MTHPEKAAWAENHADEWRRASKAARAIRREQRRCWWTRPRGHVYDLDQFGTGVRTCQFCGKQKDQVVF